VGNSFTGTENAWSTVGLVSGDIAGWNVLKRSLLGRINEFPGFRGSIRFGWCLLDSQQTASEQKPKRQEGEGSKPLVPHSV